MSTDWKFPHPPKELPAPREAGWSRLWFRIALAIGFGIAVGLLMSPRANAADLRALVAEDLETHLAGGAAFIPWAQHRVTAMQLHRDYSANEVAADQRYADGPDIVVSGEVRSVDKTFNRSAVRIVAGPYAYVSAFTPGQDAWLATLNPGDKVTLACRRVRRVVGLVGLYDCEPRAAYVRRMTQSYIESLPGMAKRGDTVAQKLMAVK